MPIINTIKGDLIKCFKSKMFDEIVHGCNCYHTMGAGIAGQIANNFPQSYVVDKTTKYGDKAKLGTSSVCNTEFGLIINAYTQFYPGKEKKNDLYNNIESCFASLNAEAPLDGKWIVGIPQIGAGIAGGNWEEIVEIINKVTPDMQIIAVEWDR